MVEYRLDGRVDVHDVDFNGMARASSILRYMQSAAQEQLTANGMSYDTLYKEHKRAFILSRLRLEIYSPLLAHMPFTAVSYPCDSRGYTFIRCHRLEAMGETVARAVSVWALINTETRELVRVDDFELGLPTVPFPELEPSRFRLPSVMREMGKYAVRYADLDQNMHMNNTRYPDMYANFLDMRGKRVRAITINYQKEAAISDELTVMGGFEGDSCFFRTVRGDGKVNSEAEILLADL